MMDKEQQTWYKVHKARVKGFRGRKIKRKWQKRTGTVIEAGDESLVIVRDCIVYI